MTKKNQKPKTQRQKKEQTNNSKTAKHIIMKSGDWGLQLSRKRKKK